MRGGSFDLTLATDGARLCYSQPGGLCSLGDCDGLCGGIRRGAVALLHDGEHSGRHASQIIRCAAGGEVRSSRAGHVVVATVYKVAQRTAIGTGGGEGRGGRRRRRRGFRAAGVGGGAGFGGSHHKVICFGLWSKVTCHFTIIIDFSRVCRILYLNGIGVVRRESTLNYIFIFYRICDSKRIRVQNG